jgi:multisubunit Na+/H+ antiporter MnhE subunit
VRVAAHWLAWWVALAALYLALADSRSVPELATGGVAAAIGASAASIVHAQRLARVRPRAAWLLRAWRALALLLVDTVVLARALIGLLVLRRRVRGRLRAVRFRAAGDDPRSAARRALVQLLGSLAPNRIVIGVDRDRDVLLVHELVPRDEPLDPLELG